MNDAIEFNSYYGSGDIAAIEAVEAKLGQRFPNAYRDIVSRLNGAVIVNRPYFTYFSRLHGREIESGTGMFLAFGDVPNCTETMEIKLRLPPEGLVQGLVMFSALGNGDALCFDYRKYGYGDNPPIVIWHHEAEPRSEEEVSEVAPTFSVLLEKLYQIDD